MINIKDSSWTTEESKNIVTTVTISNGWIKKQFLQQKFLTYLKKMVLLKKNNWRQFKAR